MQLWPLGMHYLRECVLFTLFLEIRKKKKQKKKKNKKKKKKKQWTKTKME